MHDAKEKRGNLFIKMDEKTQTIQKSRLLSILLNVSNLSAPDADATSVADAIMEKLHQLIGADAALCYLVQGKYLVASARKGPIRDAAKKHALRSDIPMNAAFIAKRLPLILTDLREEKVEDKLDAEAEAELGTKVETKPETELEIKAEADAEIMSETKLESKPVAKAIQDQLAQFLQGPGFVARGLMILPMHLHGRAIGALLLLHSQPGFFGAEERIYGMAFAHQAAIEFDNARLANDSKQRAAELRAMLSLQSAISRRLDASAVLQLVSEEAKRLSESEGAMIFMKDEKTDAWMLRSLSGAATILKGFTPNEIQQEALTKMAMSRHAYHLQRREVPTRPYASLLDFCRADCLLLMPLLEGDTVRGFIGVSGSGDIAFLANDLRILSLLSSSARMGLENAKLVEAERRLRIQEAEKATVAERERLARELHDAVTQTLFSASLVAEVLPMIWERNPEKGKEQLLEVRNLTKGALAEMRALLLELRPKAMEDTPLEELLKQLVTAVSSKAQLLVGGERTPCGILPFPVKLGFYRIAQEALNNIVKHAKASSVSVSLRKREAVLWMEICDNGKGFAIEEIPGGHLGVGIMKERAAAMGAELLIESTRADAQTGIAGGTCICLTWDSNVAGG